ncbi:hypothetical protein MNV_1230018 [Candidatus Methanoperedens nitroreducens]|uniref:Uncharacterized protein n=1 Tax=Candidatus Methanoperedens nitratireducens TaxID=1392998 RepID=A0A284VK56_9EURY|nr:hypothetical protein MNV_1230018 [Candidatus Methanoperedens nitroreducens]
MTFVAASFAFKFNGTSWDSTTLPLYESSKTALPWKSWLELTVTSLLVKSEKKSEIPTSAEAELINAKNIISDNAISIVIFLLSEHIFLTIND